MARDRFPRFASPERSSRWRLAGRQRRPRLARTNALSSEKGRADALVPLLITHSIGCEDIVVVIQESPLGSLLQTSEWHLLLNGGIPLQSCPAKKHRFTVCEFDVDWN